MALYKITLPLGKADNIIKCNECGTEMKVKDLKSTHRCLDVDDGYHEVWYHCIKCDAIIVVYFV